MYCSSIKVVIFCLRKACSSVEVYKNLPFFRFGCSFASNLIMSVKRKFHNEYSSDSLSNFKTRMNES